MREILILFHVGGSKSKSFCLKIGFPGEPCWCWTRHRSELSEGVPSHSAQTPTTELYSSSPTPSSWSWKNEKTLKIPFLSLRTKVIQLSAFFSKVKVRKPLNCALPGWLHVSVMYDENISGYQAPWAISTGCLRNELSVVINTQKK